MQDDGDEEDLAEGGGPLDDDEEGMPGAGGTDEVTVEEILEHIRKVVDVDGYKISVVVTS